MLTITGDERHWGDFARGLGRDDLVDDPRFATTPARRTHARDLVAILDKVFAERDWADWRPIFEAGGIAYSAVGTLEDVADDEQMVASGALVPMDDPRAGAALTVSGPIRIDGQEKVPPGLAPALGQHTVQVLREAGVEQAEIDRLLRAGVIVQADPPRAG
jgi:formyl-CoA transferase